MSSRRLPRTPRGSGLPRSDVDGVTWPPPLRGRSPLLCLLLLGWLGGGLLASALAVVAWSPSDLAYGLTNAAAAGVGLLLLAVAGPPLAARRSRRAAPAAQALAEPVPVPLPAQASAEREPALS